MTHAFPARLVALLVGVLVGATALPDGESFSPGKGTSGTVIVVQGLSLESTRKPQVLFISTNGLERKGRVTSWSTAALTVQAPRTSPGDYAIHVVPRERRADPIPVPGLFELRVPSLLGATAELNPVKGATITLTGVFGAVRGKVIVGSRRIRVISWTETEIVAEFPRDLPPEPQMVYVRNGAGTSGPAPLTLAGGAELPEAEVSPADLEIQVPQNNPVSFHLANVGPEGTNLLYVTQGDPDGYLEVMTNGDGTIASGEGRDVVVRVKPEYADAATLDGADLVLKVLVPGSEGDDEIPVTVRVRSAATVAQRLVGTWSGTWTGECPGPANPMEDPPTASVNGTWSLALDSVDLASGSVTGSLTWEGTDAYWTWSLDGGGHYANRQSHPFVPDRTIPFSGTRGTIETAGSYDHRFRVGILGMQGATNPSDAFYGPEVYFDLETVGGTVVPGTATFGAHPYIGGVTFASGGTLTGAKE